MRVAALLRPASNRVYSLAAPALAVAEAELVGRTQAEVVELAGIPALVCDDPEVERLINCSSVYGLFAYDGRLEPLDVARCEHASDDILTILKYPGKTNEQFTQLLVNVTVAASDFAGEMFSSRLHLLDPMCGRGTTLNQAIRYGWDTTGIEIDRKDFEAYAAFLPRWLKDNRVKHRLESGPVREHGRVVRRRLQASFSTDREAYRAGEVQTATMVCDDTRSDAALPKRESVHAIVTDLPYGVQHGNLAAGISRSPLPLLTEALPGWLRTLKPGGAIGLSWNTNVASRSALVECLANAGLDVLNEGAYLRFSHRVDAAIVRDIVVARKPPLPASQLR